MRYRSKPSLIDAIQWNGQNKKDIEKFGANVRHSLRGLKLQAGKEGAQGFVPVPLGHWIVRAAGDDTDYWPVEDEYFRSKYERA